MHTMYGNVIHNRWTAFERNWEGLQRQLDQYVIYSPFCSRGLNARNRL
jgi:hypothetical protein